MSLLPVLFVMSVQLCPVAQVSYTSVISFSLKRGKELAWEFASHLQWVEKSFPNADCGGNTADTADLNLVTA